MPPPPVTFDLLILKVVSESRVTWAIYDKFIQDNKCRILPQVSTFFYKIVLLQNNFGLFLCIIVYRLFVLNFWWCILRNFVNIS